MLVKLDASGPLYRQIYRSLRDQILKGVRQPGTAVPPTRQLAAEFGCSRNVVSLAYDQLLAEGYLQARRGSGTFVAAALTRERPVERPRRHSDGPRHLSDFSQRIMEETARRRTFASSFATSTSVGNRCAGTNRCAPSGCSSKTPSATKV